MSISFREKRLHDAIQLDIQVKKVVSIKIDRNVAEKLDEKSKNEGFSNRSDYIRNLIINYIQNNSFNNPSSSDKYHVSTRRCETTITFRLDSNLLEKIDELAREKGFTTRSDFLRYIIYSFIQP